MGVTNLRRRLNKLEALLTDSTGPAPHTQEWREFWDKQFYLFMTDQDESALQGATVDVLRALMKYPNDPWKPLPFSAEAFPRSAPRLPGASDSS
jgi:hypothetical protein